MTNKTLLSLGLATALVVSIGAAVAAAQDDVATMSPTTVQVADQDRDQIRDQDRDCDLYDGTAEQTRDRERDPAVASTDAVQVRERVRAQLHQADGDRASGSQFGRGR